MQAKFDFLKVRLRESNNNGYTATQATSTYIFM